MLSFLIPPCTFLVFHFKIAWQFLDENTATGDIAIDYVQTNQNNLTLSCGLLLSDWPVSVVLPHHTSWREIEVSKGLYYFVLQSSIYTQYRYLAPLTLTISIVLSSYMKVVINSISQARISKSIHGCIHMTIIWPIANTISLVAADFTKGKLNKCYKNTKK